MNFGKTQTMPVYNDGCFTLYDIVSVTEDDAPDFPTMKIQARNIGPIGYRELAVFDQTRMTFEQADTVITMKIAIPRWAGIGSNCVCLIGNVQHKVFNCAQVISKQGYPETELTLVKPAVKYEVYEDDDESTAEHTAPQP